MSLGDRYWTIVAIFPCVFLCLTHYDPYPSDGLNPARGIGNKFVKERKQAEKKAKQAKKDAKRELKRREREFKDLKRDRKQPRHDRKQPRREIIAESGPWDEAADRERGIRRARAAPNGVHHQEITLITKPEEWEGEKAGEYVYGLDDRGGFWREKARGRARKREYAKRPWDSGRR